MDELHSKYQQTTKEVVDIMQPSESDIIDDAEPIIVTLPDESPQESPVTNVDLDNDVEKPKKGLFARLFGGGK